jgi:hypothetical protein
MLNTKKLITAINSIDDPKRLEIITITDKSIDDQYLYDDELADYNSMLASDHGDFSSINREES